MKYHLTSPTRTTDGLIFAMAYRLCLGFCTLLVLSCSSQPTVKLAPAEPELSRAPSGPHCGSVVAGDFPDPSIIRIGSTYWATATTRDWGPPFAIMKSNDLVNWRVAGHVFNERPEWSDGDYWAPEIAHMDKSFFVYYTAKSRSSGRLCVAVATAEHPQGPYKDRGPFICEPDGSIDPSPVVTENGEKYLFWKEDGNSAHRATPIHVQKMTNDGLHLLGERYVAITNDQPWEDKLVEGPYVMKHGAWWYLFFSGNECCTTKCKYALGIARAKSILGPWEKNPNNPILKSNDVWRCPGHGSIVSDKRGRDILLYHAYNARSSVNVGRQAMVDEIQWQPDGWATINNGGGPGLHEKGFFGAKFRNAEHSVHEDFRSTELSPAWQWLQQMDPDLRIDANQHQLVLKGKTRNGDPLGAILGRSFTTADFQATTAIDTTGMKPGTLAGLGAYGDQNHALGISYGDGMLRVWLRMNGINETMVRWKASPAAVLHLKMMVQGGDRYRFAWSEDGKVWTEDSRTLTGKHLAPWDLGARVVLTAANGEGRFQSFDVKPTAIENTRACMP